MNVSRVGQTFDEIHDVLAVVAEQVCTAFQTGQGDADRPSDIIREVAQGQQEMWAIHDDKGVRAVCVLAARQYSRCRKVFVSLLAGRGMFDWADELEGKLKAYRDATESDCIEASCRPELARYLERRGWKVKAVIMEAPE